MSKASVIKLRGKIFVINLTWFELRNKKDVDQITRLLKLSYGVLLYQSVFNKNGGKEKKIVIGLSDKQSLGCYSLSCAVAQKLKSGIFITDKFSNLKKQNTEGKLYWICIFQDKEPIVKIELQDDSRKISISGDELLSQSQVEKLAGIYAQKFKVSIFCDLNDISSLNISNTIAFQLDKIVKSRISSKFLIRKVNRRYKLAIFIGVFFVFFAVCFLLYQHQQHLNSQSIQKSLLKHYRSIKSIKTPEQIVLKDIHNNGLSVVLNSIVRVLKYFPVVISGWSIQSFTYSDSNSEKIQIFYRISPGMDILTAKSSIQEILSKYPSKDRAISFMNNDQIMRLDISLNKIFSTSISRLKESNIQKYININSGVSTIASIQHNFLIYKLGKLRPIANRYSKQDISIHGIDPLVFQTLMKLANQHSNLTASSIEGKFDSSFNLIWSFKGSIYE